MKVDVGLDKTYVLLTVSGLLIAANVIMVVMVFVQTVFVAKEMGEVKKSVRVVGRPARHTHPVCARGEQSLSGVGVRNRGGIALD